MHKCEIVLGTKRDAFQIQLMAQKLLCASQLKSSWFSKFGNVENGESQLVI